jgi:hypothetical protein
MEQGIYQVKNDNFEEEVCIMAGVALDWSADFMPADALCFLEGSYASQRVGLIRP